MTKYLVVCCPHSDILLPRLVDLSFSIISLRYDPPNLISDILLHNEEPARLVLFRWIVSKIRRPSGRSKLIPGCRKVGREFPFNVHSFPLVKFYTWSNSPILLICQVSA